MRLNCLKAKPPPILWAPAATAGLAASAGSYFGTTTLCNEPLVAHVMSMAIAVVGLVYAKQNRTCICTSLAIFLLFLGRSSGVGTQGFPPWTALLDGEVVRLRCEITSEPRIMRRTKGEMLQFDHRGPVTRFYAVAAPAQTTSVQYEPTTISVRVDGICELRKGDTVDCIGWFRESPNSNNTKHALYVSTPGVVEKIYSANRSAVGEFRKAVRRMVLLGIHNKQKTLAGALFFGIRGEGWNEVSTQFRKSGMSHILAISGLHVGILVLILLHAIQKIRVGRHGGTLLVLLLLVGVLMLIEARSPAIRAAVMLCIVFTMRSGGLRCNTTGLLGVSAVVILLLYPRDAGTVGFQLSFIVVAALCVLLPHIQWRLIGPANVYGSTKRSSWHWIASLWITGFCAWIVSSPITVHVFGTISPSGLLTNVPAIGLLLASLLAVIVRLCVGWVGIAIDHIARDQLAWLLSSFLTMAERAGEIPMAYFQGIPLTWCWSAVVLSWVSWWSIAIRKRWKIWAAAPLILFGIVVGSQHPSHLVTITTVEVGHGTCHIIQHGSYTMMIDGGSKSNLNIGTNTILPTIRKLLITSIDTLVITHSDLDHIAGVVDVLNSLRVSRVLIAKQAMEHQTEPLSVVLHTAFALGVPVTEGFAGWDELSGDLHMSIVSPKSNEPFRSSNAASIVLMMRAYGKVVLFTGDIDEQKIIEIGESIQSQVDLIELPHHGQWSQESQNLINTLRPHIIIQSTSLSRHARDKWSIPQQSSRFVTAVDGTLTTTISASGVMRTTGSKHPDSMVSCCVSN